MLNILFFIADLETGGCPDSSLSQIGNDTIMKKNGWIFHGSHQDMTWATERCGEDGWFGLHAGHGVGHVKVSFKGSGNATLVFGNCWHSSTFKVTAYLNGIILAHANGNEFKTVSFPFVKGDTLKLDEDGAIIKLKSFIIQCSEQK